MSTVRMSLRTILLAAAVVLTGCQSINPAAPKLGDFKPEPARKMSTVAVPVRISMSAIAAMVDAVIQPNQQIYYTTNEPISDGVTLQMGVRRTGPVEVVTSGGCVNIALQFYLADDPRIDWVEHVRVHVGPFSWKVTDIKKMFPLGGSVRVDADVCPSIDSDWKAGATVRPNFRWVEGGYVTFGTPVGSIKIHVAGRTEPLIRDQLTSIAGKISTALSNLPLRQKLSGAWDSVQQPILLTKKPTEPATPGAMPAPEVYLIAEPAMIGIGPMQSEGAEIVATPNLSAFLKLQLGKPDTVTLPKPKPFPKNTGPMESLGVNASILAVLPYEEANKVAEQVLKTKPLEIGDKKQVTIKGLELHPDGDRVLVKVNFAARLGSLPFNDTEGTLYLRGTPRFSNQDRTVWVEDLDYDVETKNLLVKSASVLGSPVFKKMLEKALRFELGTKIDPIVEQMKVGVSGKQLASGVLLNAKAATVALDGIHIGPKAITVGLSVKGMANVAIEPFTP